MPQLGLTTHLGGPEDAPPAVTAAMTAAAAAAYCSERRALTTLVLAAVLVASVAWFGFGSVAGLLGAVRVVT